MSQTEFNCNKCELKDTDRMVQCDSCDKWFHFECVGVNSNIANESWRCSGCHELPVAQKNMPKTTQQLPLVNTIAEFSAGSRGTSSSTNQESNGRLINRPQLTTVAHNLKGTFKSSQPAVVHNIDFNKQYLETPSYPNISEPQCIYNALWQQSKIL